LRELYVLAGRRADDVLHADGPAFRSGEERRIHGDGTNASTRELEAREVGVIDTVALRVRWEHTFPDPTTFLRRREREFDDEPQAPDERRVESGAAVRRKDRQARVLLHSLQEVVDLDVRIAIVTVWHLST